MAGISRGPYCMRMARRAVVVSKDMHGEATFEPHRIQCASATVAQTRETGREIVGWRFMAVGLWGGV